MQAANLKVWWSICGFWMRVLIFSLLSVPVVCGQGPLLPAPHSPEIVPVESNYLLPPVPVGTVIESGSALPAARTPFVGDVSCPNYWIVSSRCSIQSIYGHKSWGLDVYQRLPNGEMQQTSVESLAAQIVPGIPVCVFAHGSFVKWESQCREAEQAYATFRASCPNMPVQMIFFTWPSDGPYTHILPIDASVRGERAEFNGFHMCYLLSHLPESCPTCLIGHSHGTRVVLSTLHLAGGGEIQGHVFTGSVGNRRMRAVLAAAATDHFWLNPRQRYGCAMPRVECLLNLQNRADFPLAFYSFSHPFAGGALARTGFTDWDLRRIGSNSGKITECDVTRLIGSNHLWPQYFSEPEIVSTMLPYIYFQ